MSVVMELEFSSTLLSWPRIQLMILSRWGASGSLLRPARIWPVALVWTLTEETGLMVLPERIVPVAVTAGDSVTTGLVVVLDTVMPACGAGACVAAATAGGLLNVKCVGSITAATVNVPL